MTHGFRRLGLLLTALLVVPLAAQAKDEKPAAEKPAAPAKDATKSTKDIPGLKTEDQKALYTAGASYAASIRDNLTELELSKDDLSAFLSGFTDQFNNKLKMDPASEEEGKRRQTFLRNRKQAALEKETSEGKKFVAKAAQEPGAVKVSAEASEGRSSDLIFKELTAGQGESPQPTDMVTVNYEGKLRDGTVFDSSKKNGGPVEFPLNGVIPCWTQGVQKMKAGGKAQLVCPPELAYGDNGHPPTIRGGATLIFEVELVSFKKPPAEPAAGPGAVKPKSD